MLRTRLQTKRFLRTNRSKIKFSETSESSLGRLNFETADGVKATLELLDINLGITVSSPEGVTYSSNLSFEETTTSGLLNEDPNVFVNENTVDERAFSTAACTLTLVGSNHIFTETRRVFAKTNSKALPLERKKITLRNIFFSRLFSSRKEESKNSSFSVFVFSSTYKLLDYFLISKNQFWTDIRCAIS